MKSNITELILSWQLDPPSEEEAAAIVVAQYASQDVQPAMSSESIERSSPARHTAFVTPSQPPFSDSGAHAAGKTSFSKPCPFCKCGFRALLAGGSLCAGSLMRLSWLPT